MSELESPDIVRIEVDSKGLVSVGYSADHKILEAEFRSGEIYRYFLVPERVYETFKDSDSKGTYFREAIQNLYPFTRISTPSPIPRPDRAAGAGGGGGSADSLLADLQRSLDA